MVKNSNNVDSMLKNLGAEPLFSCANDTSSGSNTTSLGNNDIKVPIISYPIPQDSNTPSASLIQSFNEKQDIQNLTPQMPNEEITMGVGSNPISILNELYQRERKSGLPPTYSFTIDPINGRFYCQLEIFGKVFKTDRPTIKKQQAKEDAALMALRYAVNESEGGSSIVIPKLDYFENRTDHIGKSERWYRKQLSDSPTKKPRVILLEFCQMQRLSNPIYHPRNDHAGNTLCDCIVGDRTFIGDKAFIKTNDAKDYVANVAFGALYEEYCKAEKYQIRKLQRDGQETSSHLNESDSSSSTNSILNVNSSHLNEYNSNNLFLTVDEDIPSIKVEGLHSNNFKFNSHSTRSQNLNEINSNNLLNFDQVIPNIKVEDSHVEIPDIKVEKGSNDFKLNSNSTNSQHLNETNSNNLLLIVDQDIPNIKIEDSISSLAEIPNIKTEEGSNNFNFNSNSTRSQQQNTSSSTISFHPYQRSTKNAGYKKYTSLLFEMVQSKRWLRPDFTFENGVDGFVCKVGVRDYLFRGKAYNRKMDAKESASEEAYRYLTKYCK
ncbi:15477_t:CDS:1 [Funneliformis geosporum]|uniref:4824_t:CDS:1 n=1 Tax=Funneliformis geosporum TaxID=1117311 RepID=A0A9W4SD45_9GLOM|nr:4824_t:CDS:1 [Funneliformis geosporum]CAI2174998.1 15477_t:CDS:1 [Funneliformis geosporum]